MLQCPGLVVCPSSIPEEVCVNQNQKEEKKEEKKERKKRRKKEKKKKNGYSLGTIKVAAACSYALHILVLYYRIYVNARRGFFLELALKFVRLS